MPETHIFKELFFDGDKTPPQVDEDGRIWKPVLRTGLWEVGPHGRPLMVVAGYSADQRSQIGLMDILDAFNEGAIEHVTIPTTHDDLVDQNTGYVDPGMLRVIKGDDGVTRLWAGHRFTEPEIKGKVERGSIANTSVGLEFDYVRKEDGRKFPVVLKHVALTNRPWINRLTPFGVAASEDTYEVEALCFSEPAKDDSANDPKVPWTSAGLTLAQIKEQIEKTEGVSLLMAGADSALIQKGDDIFVAKFAIEDGNVKLDESDQWEKQVAHTSPSGSTSDPARTIDDKGDPPNDIPKEKEGDVPEPQPNSEPVTVTPEQLAQFQATLDGLKTELAETKTQLETERTERARLAASNDQLTAKERERTADDLVTKLKGFGFTEESGHTEFLKRVRTLVLSDQGEATVLLSEDGAQQPTPRTVTDVLMGLFETLPTDDKTGQLKIDLSQQVTDPLRRADGDKPPASHEKVELSDKEKDEEAEALFSEMFPTEAQRLAAATPKES